MLLKKNIILSPPKTPNTMLFIAFSFSNTDFNEFDLTHSHREANKTKVSNCVLLLCSFFQWEIILLDP